ncbi:nucleoporin NUP42 isoform X2 [Panthera tigris]|uniref:nucleoporin NUP42 isoform X2 n=2 Tax=Panthera tigris TaxID=9694 RepID=UPI001C6FC459|nr:nucleoporin NUP42 isoform X2 [Panthera tigris]XP_042824063.1 nucleoporin NUP42 isoform X2 [Panthera tigris]XP_042824071.1 nucleoporin NUP42 isoform X2 [Panthera tigris]
MTRGLINVVTDVDGIPPARDTPVLSSHPASPNPHHGGAAEIKKNHLSVRILELQLAGTGDLDYPRIHLLHPALMSRKMKRNFCFTDISPEELRLEYHNYLTSNNLQSYLNSLQQLINQWRNRVNELKNLNTSANIASLSDVKGGVNQAAATFGFGSMQGITFGPPGFPVHNSSSANAQNFSFKPSSGFASAASGSPSVFGNTPAFGAAPPASSAITTSTPTFGFGKPAITSAASFSFKSPAASSFGSPGFSGFPAPMAAGSVGAPAFGSGTSVAGFGNLGSHSHSAFSKSSSDTFGNSSISTSLPVSNGSITTDNVLFTPKDQLTAEELEQFQSKKFTLGKIPLKPPPVELLNI